MTSCSSDYSPATPPPAHDFTGPGPEIYGEPDLGPWHAAYQDHRNLIGRRRRREITLVKKCHQIHIDSGCEVYLVISHRDDDRHVIYNSEPSQNWPPPPERLVCRILSPSTFSPPEWQLMLAVQLVPGAGRQHANEARQHTQEGPGPDPHRGCCAPTHCRCERGLSCPAASPHVQNECAVVEPSTTVS